MYFVQKFNVGRWETFFKGHRRDTATELVFTLSKTHPDRAYRLVIVKEDTIKAFWPEVVYRGGSPVHALK
jgi:hypothetical protein